MPSGTRIRSNSEFGLTTDAPLTAGATSFNSARLALMPVVSSAHAIVTLDPRAINGEPEIVVMTAHTAAATVATITRAAYGTAARSHPAGTEWIHAPVDEDFIEIVTSATRPTDPYEGQFIYETDTNKLVGYGGVDWASRDAGGLLAYVTKTSSQSGISAEATITFSAAVTPTIPTGRRILISAFLHCVLTNADAAIQVRLKQDGSEIQFSQAHVPVAGARVDLSPKVVLNPSAGPHTYTVTAVLAGGAGTVAVDGFGNDPSYLMIEDIGAA